MYFVLCDGLANIAQAYEAGGGNCPPRVGQDSQKFRQKCLLCLGNLLEQNHRLAKLSYWRLYFSGVKIRANRKFSHKAKGLRTPTDHCLGNFCCCSLSHAQPAPMDKCFREERLPAFLVRQCCLYLLKGWPYFPLVQGGPRLRAWRAALRFEEKLAGRKERNSTEIERLVCCSNRPTFAARPTQFLILGYILSFLFVCLRLETEIFC